MRAQIPLVTGLLIAALLAGCGDGAGEPGQTGTPQTGFAEALATLGGAGSGEQGFGWVDVEALRAARGGPAEGLEWAADALGPGGDDIARGEGTAPVGIDPAQADQIVSVAGSYAIGVRLDGVDTDHIETALRDLARPRKAGSWEIFDVSETATTPLGSPLEGLSSYPSRAAVMPGSVVLARFLLGRTALIGRGDSPIETPLVTAAVSCLGDVIAARIVPNNFTYLGSVAPQLFAFGVASEEHGWREVLCVLDEDQQRVDEAAAGMSAAFAPEASDIVTDEPMSELIAGADVSTLDFGGVPAARAALDSAPGATPGLVFRAFPRGSTLTYVGLRHPYPNGSEPSD